MSHLNHAHKKLTGRLVIKKSEAHLILTALLGYSNEATDELLGCPVSG